MMQPTDRLMGDPMVSPPGMLRGITYGASCGAQTGKRNPMGWTTVLAMLFPIRCAVIVFTLWDKS